MGQVAVGVPSTYASAPPGAINLRRGRSAQVRALLRKNAILKFRGCQACCTVLQLLLPVVFFALMSLPKVFLDEWSFNESIFPETQINDAVEWGLDSCPLGTKLYYSPDTPQAAEVARAAVVDMLCTGGAGVNDPLEGEGSSSLVSDIPDDSIGAFWNVLLEDPQFLSDSRRPENRTITTPQYRKGSFYERVAACNYGALVKSGDLQWVGLGRNAEWALDTGVCNFCEANPELCATELSPLLEAFPNGEAAEEAAVASGEALVVAQLEGLGTDDIQLTLRVNGTSVLDELAHERRGGQGRGEESNPFSQMFMQRWTTSDPMSGTWRKWYSLANVQAAVERALVKQAADAPPEANLRATIKGFPYPGRIFNLPGFIAGIFLSLVLPLAFITDTVVTIKAVVVDKELRIREGMAMMGLYDSAYWLAHFITQFGVMTVTFIIVSLVSLYPLEHSDFWIHFIFFEVWAVAFILHCFFLSTFFTKGRIAALAGSMFYLFQLAPAITVVTQSPDGAAAWNSVCILPGSAMYMWGVATTQLESSSVGVTAATFGDNLNQAGPPFGPSTIMLNTFGSIFLYAFLTFYLDRVLPKTYGTRLPPHFLFLPSWWKAEVLGSGYHTDEGDTLRGLATRKPAPHPESVQTLSEDELQRVSVRTSGVTKRFGTVTAVDGLDLEMVEGQVSGLLGHNGAGKTTSINMLSGMLPPTEGEGMVGGLDIRTEMAQIRGSLGVCPQFDILWPTLTVMEHLRTYAAFKGVPAKLVDSEAAATAARVGLAALANRKSSELSGGQRRKLSLGIAFIGGPKVVFLDEPTTGMDPESRRFVWTMIENYKADRTILLTTHFMDEADVLCDRIVIMSQGSIAAAGSSVFLKSRFGIGYTITMSTSSADSESADRLAATVKRHVDGAELTSRVGTELALRLPNSSTGAFGGLLRELEESGRANGLDSYGLSCTTLEEVFLKIAEGAAAHEVASHHGHGAKLHGAAAPAAIKGVTDVKEDFGGGGDRATGGALLRQQFSALMLKRWVNARRDRLNLCTQIITPVLCLLAALAINNIEPRDGGIVFSPVTYSREFAGNKPPVFGAAPGQGAGAATAMANFPGGGGDFVGEVPLADGRFCWCPAETQTVSEIYGFAFGARGDEVCAMPELDDGHQFYGVGLACDDFISTMDADMIASVGKVDYSCDVQRGTTCDAFYFNQADAEAKAYDVVVMPNPTALHSVPVAINSVHNAMLGALGSTASITLTNEPLPVIGSDDEREDSEQSISLTTAIFVLIGMSTLSASFAVFLVWERNNNAKHLQIVSGINQLMFWLAAYLADLLNYLVPVGLMLMLCAIMPSRGLHEADTIGAFAVLLLLFGLGALPLAYLAHFRFKGEMAALAALIMAFQFFGMATTIASAVLEQIGQEAVYDVVKYAFRLIPHYCLGRGVLDITGYYDEAQSYERESVMARTILANILSAGGAEGFDPEDIQLNADWMDSTFFAGLPEEQRSAANELVGFILDRVEGGPPKLWTADRLGYHMLFLLLDAVLFMSAVLYVEYKQTRIAKTVAKYTGRKGALEPSHLVQAEDEDVAKERAEVKAGHLRENTALLLDGLTKTYPNGTRATRQLCAQIANGQCFGLLGINGAGKTTTFRMLTGEFLPSEGDALLLTEPGDGASKLSVTNQIEAVRRHIGYCPQFDGLQPNMTCAEHLRFYALSRGVPPYRLQDVGKHLLARMGLTKYTDRRAGTLSGGNKRKLSVAIALIGDPQLVLLDEPSSGMDPQARRFMWDVLSSVMPGRCMVLTSHSMEECEALCSRLGIMVGGRFRCLGGLQHLKSRFSEGYTLDFRTTGPADTASVKAYIEHSVRGAALREEGPTHLRFQCAESGEASGLADVFQAIESGRASGDLSFEDYSVGQTTLEQVFLRMAREGAQEAELEKQLIIQEAMARARDRFARMAAAKGGPAAATPGQPPPVAAPTSAAMPMPAVPIEVTAQRSAMQPGALPGTVAQP